MKNICFKKFFASFLTFLFLMQQTMVLPAFASEITSGVSGNVNIESNPISNGHNTEFNIRPDFNSGDFGFKHYTNFNLSEGDVANLIFALKNGGDISKFVNLVDNRIIINGILNGVLSNGNIGGHAIFVSPQGMVVGASGVLNVGALTAIAPTQQAYTKYIVDSAIGDVLPEGYTHENNLAVLKASDMALIKDEKGNIIPAIDVQGKIIARQGVELVAKNIRVGNTVDNKAGILAGVNNNAVTNDGQNVNAKLASTEAAGKLFDALVSNDIKNGSGFSKDPNGNIVIKAQSIKQAVNPGIVEKISVYGKEYIVEDLLDENTGNWLDKNLLPEELQKLGVDGDYLTSVLKTTIQNSIPSDATNANAHNDTNFATVDISNAILKASNSIDISATSKVDYIATNTTILDSMFTSSFGQMIEGAITGEKFDFEGARAKATVNINSGTELISGGDVNLSSNAVANTLYKSASKYAPGLDTTQELYYALGSKTVSSVDVMNGAKINAGNNLNLHAQSQNAHSIKIKNPTSTIGATIDKVVGIPNIQVIILANQVEADTTAAIHSGAIVEAANVEVDAVNHSSISSNVQALANITPDANSGAAVAVNINNTHINTNALIDTKINTHDKGSVSVNAQNLYMGSTIAKADVTSDAPKKNFIDKMKSQILSKVVDKFAGLLDMGGNGPIIDTSGLPNVSVATVINDSNVNTNATIGKNASIHADNVKVNANTIDLTVNNATSNVKIESKKDGSGSSGVSGFIPNPGVAVIVNEQNNSTKAVIESGTDTNHATVVANNKLDVNATTESWM